MKRKLLVGMSAFLMIAASQLKDAEQIRKLFGLDAYPLTHQMAQVKVAILDNGFAGVERGGYLPASAKIVETYDEAFITKWGLGDPKYQPRFDGTDHGRIMAQLVWEMTGRQEGGPQFYLLNASGITGFRRAVRYAIEEKVDIILYSQNRECCGHFDGGGFLNAIVNQATQAGILWINAAGNYGGRVFNAALNPAGQTLRIKSHLDENAVQIVLNWNSQGPEEESGTDKDLDMYVYDSSNSVVAKSELKQVWKKEKLEENETFLPRERIRTELAAGDYRIVVQAKSKNWNGNDRIRVVVIPEREPVQGQNGSLVDAVELLDKTQGQEIMVPADNPNVLTVGDTNPYSAQGPTMDGRAKPDVILEKSDTMFTDGRGTTGTSNAAALFAGIAAVMKAHRPNLTYGHFLLYIQRRLAQRPPGQAPAMLPIRNVTFQELLQMHRPLMIAVEDVVKEGPVLTGRFTDDGHYTAAYTSSPEEITGRICGQQLVQNPRGDERYFLGFGKAPNLPPGCARSQTQNIICCAKTFESPYPWESFRVTTREFLEVRQARPVEEGGGAPATPASSSRIWRTPTPEELSQF